MSEPQQRIAELEAELAKMGKDLFARTETTMRLERENAELRVKADEIEVWKTTKTFVEMEQLKLNANQLLAQNARLISLSSSLLNWCRCTNPCAFELRQAISETPAESLSALFGPTVELLKGVLTRLNCERDNGPLFKLTEQELARIRGMMGNQKP